MLRVRPDFRPRYPGAYQLPAPMKTIPGSKAGDWLVYQPDEEIPLMLCRAVSAASLIGRHVSREPRRKKTHLRLV